jgi:hypothetical protein
LQSVNTSNAQHVPRIYPRQVGIDLPAADYIAITAPWMRLESWVLSSLSIAVNHQQGLFLKSTNHHDPDSQ